LLPTIVLDAVRYGIETNVTRCGMPLIRGAGSMPAIEMTRKALRVSQLRATARTADAKQARRILAIAMGLDGSSRRLAAPAGGIDRQTRATLMHRSKRDGVAGLADRPRPGRRLRLAEAQSSEVAKRGQDGPDRKTRWRAALALSRLG
jgi:hypothetical protein